MRGYYINLAHSPERRERLERALGEVFGADHGYRRIEAVDGRRLAPAALNGMSPGAAGAYLSHLAALDSAAADGAGSVHVLEDDCALGLSLPGVLAMADAARLPFDWDFLFTSVVLGGPGEMARFLESFRRHRARGVVGFERLGPGCRFAGFASYIVNGERLDRVRAALREASDSGRPVDLVVRDLAWQGRLGCYVVVPFATSHAPESDRSTIGERRATIQACRHFADLLAPDRDPEACLGEIRALAAAVGRSDARGQALVEAVRVWVAPEPPDVRGSHPPTPADQGLPPGPR